MSERMLQFFAYEHLRHDLRPVVKPFCELARWMDATLPHNAERTLAFRKLIESKDNAVRSFVAQEDPDR